MWQILRIIFAFSFAFSQCERALNSNKLPILFETLCNLHAIGQIFLQFTDSSSEIKHLKFVGASGL